MFKCDIETGNAAFDDNPGAELARILREIAATVETMGLRDEAHKYVRDANGNSVGEWYWTLDKD